MFCINSFFAQRASLWKFIAFDSSFMRSTAESKRNFPISRIVVYISRTKFNRNPSCSFGAETWRRTRPAHYALISFTTREEHKILHVVKCLLKYFPCFLPVLIINREHNVNYVCFRLPCGPDVQTGVSARKTRAPVLTVVGVRVCLISGWCMWLSLWHNYTVR
jgi:hypothetical protein